MTAVATPDTTAPDTTAEPGATTTEPRFGTRWPRAIALMVPALLAVCGIGLAVARGAVAAEYTAQDSLMTLGIGEFSGGRAAIVAVDQPLKTSAGEIQGHYQLRIGVQSATGTNICAAQQAWFFGRPVTLLIYIPSLQVDGLSLDAEVAAGNVAMSGNVDLNVNAADVNLPGVPTLGGQPQDLGIIADGLTLKGTAAQIRSGTVTSAKLPLSAQLVDGAVACPAPTPSGGGGR